MKKHACNTLVLTCLMSITAIGQVDITPLWVRVGDAYGAVDVEKETESIECAVFSPDEKIIASGSKKGWDIMVWDADSGEKLWEEKADEEIEVVHFTQDGKYVLSGGEDKKLRIWEVQTGEEVKSIDNLAGFDAMDVSHRGHLLAGGDEAGQILLFDTQTWERLDLVQQGRDELTGAPKGVHADVNQLHFSVDDKWLLSAGRNQEVKRWKVTRKNKLIHDRTYYGHTGSVKSVRISPDNKYVAAGAGNASGVRIWDFETGELVHHIPATGMIMETIEFTPDGKYLFVGGNEGEGKKGAPVENEGFENNDGLGHIRAYRVSESGDPNFELVMEKPVFRQEYFDFTRDGKLLLTSHEDGTLRLWEVHYGSWR
jgi:WD40 repeat protein